MNITNEDRKFLKLDIPAGTIIPNSDKLPPSQESEVGIYKISDILNWAITGLVEPFPFNRGDASVSEKTWKSVAAGIKQDLVGECTIGILEDSPNKIHFSGWHSRLYGCLKRHLAGEMLHDEYNMEVSVRRCSDFTESYQGQSGSTNCHKIKEKLANPLLACGEWLQKIRPKIGEQIYSKLNSKWSTVTTTIIYSLHLENKEQISWDWTTFYGRRNAANKLANEKAGLFSISENQLNKIADAIKFWFELNNALIVAGNKVKLDRLLTSSGWFGLVVTDYYQHQGQGIFTTDHEFTSEQICSEVTKSLETAPALCRASSDDQEKAVTHFKDLLKYAKAKKTAKRKSA